MSQIIDPFYNTFKNAINFIMQLPSLIIQALALPPVALALGINCRGSRYCHGVHDSIVSTLEDMVRKGVSEGASGTFYNEGSAYQPTE